MNHGLKPYPAYKDSGLPWLGEVPEHWELKRAKFFFHEVDERSTSGEEELLSVSHKTGVTPRREKNVTMFLAQSNVGHKLCRSGDLVVNTMWAWMAALGVSEYEGLVSPSYGVYRLHRSQDFLSSYLDKLLRTPSYRSEYVVRSTGITSSRLRLYPESFLQIPLVCPPSTEQAAIVRYLDYMDGRIRRYIRAKQKLIKLLEEQKQSIIHQAVTGQIDVRTGQPYPAYKPSGVELLGEVPEHWTVRKLGHMAAIFNGSTPSRMQPAYWQGGTIPWISSGKVNDYIITTPSELVTEQALRESSISLVPKDSVVIGLVGQGRTRGMSAYLDIDTCINQNLAAIVPRNDLYGRFLHHVLAAHYKTIRESGRGGNQEALNCEIVAMLRFPIPPFEEQTLLANYIETTTLNLVNMCNQTNKEIDLLREYQTRLIADVVTGKLDVRQAAAGLPEEVAEPELLEEVADIDADDAIADDLDEEIEEEAA